MPSASAGRVSGAAGVTGSAGVAATAGRVVGAVDGAVAAIASTGGTTASVATAAGRVAGAVVVGGADRGRHRGCGRRRGGRLVGARRRCERGDRQGERGQRAGHRRRGQFRTDPDDPATLDSRRRKPPVGLLSGSALKGFYNFHEFCSSHVRLPFAGGGGGLGGFGLRGRLRGAEEPQRQVHLQLALGAGLRRLLDPHLLHPEQRHPLDPRQQVGDPVLAAFHVDGVDDLLELELVVQRLADVEKADVQPALGAGGERLDRVPDLAGRLRRVGRQLDGVHLLPVLLHLVALLDDPAGLVDLLVDHFLVLGHLGVRLQVRGQGEAVDPEQYAQAEQPDADVFFTLCERHDPLRSVTFRFPPVRPSRRFRRPPRHRRVTAAGRS